MSLAGIEGSACLPWDRERWRGGAALRTSRRRTRGSTAGAAAERFSADRMAARVVAAWRALLDEAA